MPIQRSLTRLELLITPFFLLLCAAEIAFPFWNSFQAVTWFFVIGGILTGATHYALSVGTYFSRTETRTIMKKSWLTISLFAIIAAVGTSSIVAAYKNSGHLFDSLLLNQAVLVVFIWIRVSHNMKQSFGITSLRLRKIASDMYDVKPQVDQVLRIEKFGSSFIALGISSHIYKFQPKSLLLIDSSTAGLIGTAFLIIGTLIIISSFFIYRFKNDLFKIRVANSFKYFLFLAASFSGLGIWGIKWLHYVEYVNLTHKLRETLTYKRIFYYFFFATTAVLVLAFSMDKAKYSIENLIPIYEFLTLTWTISLFIHIAMDQEVFKFKDGFRRNAVLSYLKPTKLDTPYG